MSVSFKTRMPLAQARAIASSLGPLLEKAGMTRVEFCGSLRRQKDTVGDLDVVVDGPVDVLRLNPHWVWMEGGSKKATLDFRGAQVNVLHADGDNWGAAVLYFTGPHDYNIAYRRRAKSMGMLLNEYGLWKDGKRIAGATESEIYDALGKTYKDPWMRGK